MHLCLSVRVMYMSYLSLSDIGVVQRSIHTELKKTRCNTCAWKLLDIAMKNTVSNLAQNDDMWEG